MISDGPGPVNPFNPQLWSRIEQAIENIKRQYEPPHIAAFDADGTLWGTDVGELLFQYQLIHRIFSDCDSVSAKYRRLIDEKNHEPLYRWQAELNGGQSAELVRQWIEASQAGAVKPTIFADQQKLMSLLLAQEFTVYVVSASFEPTVVHAVGEHFSLPAGQVIAVTLPLENGVYRLSSEQTVTCGKGKVERLLEITDSVPPAFSCGNTLGDLELLQCATHFRLAVSSVPEDHVNFASENGLYRVARQNSWAHHRF